MKQIIIVFLLIAFASSSFAQGQAFNDRSRSIYILDIIKYVDWSETASPFDFRVAILDPDTVLMKHMRKEAKTKAEIHGKPINIMHYTSIDQIGNVDVIFFERHNKYSIDRVFQKIAGKEILLITEGYQFHKSMVNFLIINGFKRFEVNEAKIKAAGLKVDKKLLISSVKSEADWSNLYEESLINLAQYKRTVMKQRELIRNQKVMISDQLQKISDQEENIRLQLLKLETLKLDIELQQKRLAQGKSDLRKEKNRILAKEKEVLKQNQILKDQSLLIENQKEELNKQRATMELQSEKIEEDLILIEEQETHSHFEINKIKQELAQQKRLIRIAIPSLIGFSSILLIGLFIQRKRSEK